MATSVIDTLITVFKLDDKDFNRHVKQSEKNVNDAEKAMNNAEKANAAFDKSFTTLAGKIAAGVGTFVALNKVIHGFSAAVDASIELNNLSQATNMSMASISAWGHAAVENGGSAESMRGSIKSLHSDMMGFVMSGDTKLIPALNFMGISMQSFIDKGRNLKPMEGNLLKIADGLERVNKQFGQQKALEVGKILGFDTASTIMMMKGRVAMEELAKKKAELGALDAKNAATAMQYKVALDVVRAKMQQIYMAIGSAFLPALEAVVDVFSRTVSFFQRHEGFTDALFKGILAISGLIASVFIPTIWRLTAALLMNPIFWIPAIIMAVAAAFAFLSDDIENFLAGNVSVIGAVVDKWKEFKEFLFGLWDGIKSAIANLWESMKPPEWLMDIIGGIGSLMGSAANFVMGANDNPMNSQTSTSIVGGATNTVNNNIKASATVNTQATDAAGTAKAVNSTLADQLRMAVSNGDDGLLA